MSFTAGSSRPLGLRYVTGSRPGVVDRTQPSRVLNTPNATLSFASYDAFAATGIGGDAKSRRRKYDRDPARPKRIVIEIMPGSMIPNKWRFVPSAHRAPGVEDEGVWPRLVILCGEPCIMSEDQWDIYKLDPAYDCFVPANGHPVISRKDPQQWQETLSSRASSTSEHTSSKKRRARSPGTDGDDQSANLNKKFRTVVSLVTDEEGSELEEITESDEEDEVEEIVVEETPKKGSANSQTQERRKAREERTQERRAKVKAKTDSTFEPTRSKTPDIVDLTMEDSSPDASLPDGTPAAGPTKRKVFSGGESPEERSPREREYQSNKRARTQSPRAIRAELNRKRTDRDRRRLARMQERLNGLKEHREQRLWDEILADTPLPSPPPSQHSAGDEHHPAPEATQSSASQGDDDAARRQAAIEESRRKLAELEKDRPLWEQEARKRAMQEQLEEEARRIRKEQERLRAAEAAEMERRQRRRAETETVEAERRAQAERVRVEREREQRRRKERERWSYGPWTTTRAIERYKMLCEEFDAAKFSVDNPVDFEMVPWPVLHNPLTLRLENIEWSAVEAFFEAAKKHMRGQDYKAFVEKSHKRFHPDRWRARGVLKSITDDELRGCLEVAANTVAQALTPIWRELRG